MLFTIETTVKEIGSQVLILLIVEIRLNFDREKNKAMEKLILVLLIAGANAIPRRDGKFCFNSSLS
jgi:hypothetical protein